MQTKDFLVSTASSPAPAPIFALWRKAPTRNYESSMLAKYILENYIPIAKATATKGSEIFPKLNDVEGEGLCKR
jgi:hypothetical protein